MRILILRFVTLVMFASLISGCSLFKKSSESPIGILPAPKANLAIKSTPDMNSGNRVRVLVYQLKSKDNFMSSSRVAFWTVADAFSGDVVETDDAKLDFIIEPGTEKENILVVTDETRFIGVAADFLNPGTQWRTVHEIVPGRSVRLKIDIELDQVVVQ